MALNLQPNHVSAVMAVILFTFGLVYTITNYRKEQDASRKQQYLVQMILTITLVCFFIFGMLYFYK